jgi:hypothetical protein
VPGTVAPVDANAGEAEPVANAVWPPDVVTRPGPPPEPPPELPLEPP